MNGLKTTTAFDQPIKGIIRVGITHSYPLTH